MSEAYDPSEDGAEAPEILTLPLDGWHRARGGRMVEFAGYHMPVQYEGILAEHLWTREHAGLFDVSHMGQVSISPEEGGDLGAVERALEALLPADLAALKLGRIRYSLLLNEDGGILDDLMVTRWADHFFLVVNGATKWDDLGHLRENLADDITLSLLDDHALLALQGPEAALALASLGLAPVDGAPVVEALSFMQAGRYLWQGRPLGVSRSGYTGEDGYEISVEAEDAEALADALAAHPSVKPIGLGARDSLRLEAGLPLYGHDLSESTDPISAGLAFAISKRRREEGGFPGAQRILSALADGTPTTRVGLVLAGRQAAREGAEVFDGDAKVGIVTSGGFAPSLGQPIAMADVPSALAAPGTQLFIDVRGKKLAATITPMPFVPHRYFRTKKGAAQ